VLGIVRCRLGDGKVTELALGLLLQQGRRDDGVRVLVGAGRHPVQLIDVDVVGAELAERVAERGDGAGGAGVGVANAERRLGGNDDLISWDRLQRFAEQPFGAVSSGLVEQIDPEVKRLVDQPDGLGFALAVAEPEPAEPAAASPATLTLSPVRPSVTYSMTSPNACQNQAKTRPPSVHDQPHRSGEECEVGSD
jgi:hypothetical protein